MAYSALLDPNFWVACGTAAIQLPAALLSLVQLAKCDNKTTKTSKEASVAAHKAHEAIQKIGEPIKHMQAWKQMHDVLQDARDSFVRIDAIMLGVRGENASVDVFAALRDEWRLFRSQSLDKGIESRFTDEQAELVRHVEISGNVEDWREKIRGYKKQLDACFSDDVDKQDCKIAFRTLGTIKTYLDQGLSKADTILFESITNYAKIWYSMESQFSDAG